LSQANFIRVAATDNVKKLSGNIFQHRFKALEATTESSCSEVRRLHSLSISMHRVQNNSDDLIARYISQKCLCFKFQHAKRGVAYFVKPPVFCSEDYGKHHMFTGYVKRNVQLTKHLHLYRHLLPLL
jgi:hypothetical protein